MIGKLRFFELLLCSRSRHFGLMFQLFCSYNQSKQSKIIYHCNICAFEWRFPTNFIFYELKLGRLHIVAERLSVHITVV